MGNMQRNNSIDAIKGVAITLVMLGHVFVHNHMEDGLVYDFIKAVQMPLFMIVSGYLCGQGRKVSDVRSYAKIMKKRAISYLIPFFAWLTVMHPFDLIGSYKVIFVQLDFGLWFLAVLFILTFMVYTAQLIAGKWREKKPLLSELIFWSVYGVFCCVIVIQILIGNEFLSPYLTIIYVPFYMMGYVAGNYGKKYFCWGTKEDGKFDCKTNRLMQTMMLFAAAGFLYLVVEKNLNSMETKMDIIVQMLASFLGSMAIIYGVFCWKDGKLKQFFQVIGLYTLEIYVVHYHFANILNFYDKQYDFYTLPGFGFVLVSFAVMCMITFVAVWVMKKVRLVDGLFFGKF